MFMVLSLNGWEELDGVQVMGCCFLGLVLGLEGRMCDKWVVEPFP